MCLIFILILKGRSIGSYLLLGGRGKSVYTSVGGQVISTKVACPYWYQVTSSFLGTVDGTSVFTKRMPPLKPVAHWSVLWHLWPGMCCYCKPCFSYIPCHIHGNPKVATFLNVPWFQHLSGSLRLKIFFVLWLIPPSPMTFVLQCLPCSRLCYRTDLNTKPYNLISYEDVAQLIWLKKTCDEKEGRENGLFPLVFFYLIQYISWINRFFSIAIPHKSGKWVMDFWITTFIILDLISIRVEKKCFSVYNHDPGIVTELHLHCWWGASLRFADLKHFKVAKWTWHQERGGDLSWLHFVTEVEKSQRAWWTL